MKKLILLSLLVSNIYASEPVKPSVEILTEASKKMLTACAVTLVSVIDQDGVDKKVIIAFIEELCRQKLIFLDELERDVLFLKDEISNDSKDFVLLAIKKLKNPI